MKVYGENVRVVICVRIGFVIRQESDFVAVGAEGKCVIIEGPEVSWRGSGLLSSTIQTCVRRASEKDVRDLYWMRSMTRGSKDSQHHHQALFGRRDIGDSLRIRRPVKRLAGISNEEVRALNRATNLGRGPVDVSGPDTTLPFVGCEKGDL